MFGDVRRYAYDELGGALLYVAEVRRAPQLSFYGEIDWLSPTATSAATRRGGRDRTTGPAVKSIALTARTEQGRAIRARFDVYS